MFTCIHHVYRFNVSFRRCTCIYLSIYLCTYIDICVWRTRAHIATALAMPFTIISFANLYLHVRATKFACSCHTVAPTHTHIVKMHDICICITTVCAVVNFKIPHTAKDYEISHQNETFRTDMMKMTYICMCARTMCAVGKFKIPSMSEYYEICH